MTDRFSDIDEVRNWYVVSLDGLKHLRRVVGERKPLHISSETADQIFGMSQSEWEQFFSSKESEHESYASLALLAACEGGIRRDYLWRRQFGAGRASNRHFLTLPARKKHIPLSGIFTAWQKTLPPGDFFQKQLNQLRDLYADRNTLAHGRASLQQFDFSSIYHRLSVIRQKWRQASADFRGF